MITDKLTLWMMTEVDNLTPQPFSQSLSHWIILGYYDSFQASEWSQKQHRNYLWVLALPSKPPEALVSTNFEFFNEGAIPVMDAIICLFPSIACVKQKNNRQNGEKFHFSVIQIAHKQVRQNGEKFHF